LPVSSCCWAGFTLPHASLSPIEAELDSRHFVDIGYLSPQANSDCATWGDCAFRAFGSRKGHAPHHLMRGGTGRVQAGSTPAHWEHERHGRHTGELPAL